MISNISVAEWLALVIASIWIIWELFSRVISFFLHKSGKPATDPIPSCEKIENAVDILEEKCTGLAIEKAKKIIGDYPIRRWRVIVSYTHAPSYQKPGTPDHTHEILLSDVTTGATRSLDIIPGKTDEEKFNYNTWRSLAVGQHIILDLSPEPVGPPNRPESYITFKAARWDH